jgi:hypothetical protein
LARHQFAVISLLVIALASSFWVLLDVAGEYSKTLASVGVPAYESRFAELRKMATPQSVFGYTSDNPPSDPSDLAEFYLTQYTLAPAIVITSVQEQLVVANFHVGNPDTARLQAMHLTPVQNFGHGVILCSRDKTQ